MEYEKTPLWGDAKKIINDPIKTVRYGYLATMNLPDVDYPIMRINSRDRIRDYATSIGDQIFMEIWVPMGDYIKLLYPNKDNLEITIRQYDYFGLSPQVSKKGNTFERFKCIIMPGENPVYNAAEFDQADQQSLNLADILNIKIQLVDKGTEAIRLRQVQGVFKKVTRESLIKSILGSETAKIKIDGKPPIDGVDIAKVNNTEIIQQAVIPSGTPLLNIPTLIHNQFNGVYLGGIGSYIQSYQNKRYWFVYPLYDTSRYNSSSKKLIAYYVPDNKMPGIEKTYRVDGGNIHILATGLKGIKEDNATGGMNHGGGFQMLDSRTVMRKPAETTDDGPVGKQSQITHDVVLGNRPDGANVTNMSKPSGNVFKEYARALERTGGVLTLQWENANASYLYPGMPVQYRYLDNGKLAKVDGTLLWSHEYTEPEGTGPFTTVYKTMIVMSVFINRGVSA